jgi:hypothetical protein
MTHLHKALNVNTKDIISVKLSGPAFVMLMDDNNYNLYCNDLEYEYYGREVKQRSPYRLRAPVAGRWHLVIEQSDPAQSVDVAVQIEGDAWE